MEYEFLFQIAILIMSVVIHEVAHGVTANALGDPTAKYEGRLTLNPIKHLDFMGSIIVPAISFFMGGFIFGWAKPVPYNPYNLKPGRGPEALVAAAGPISNFSLAVIFGLLLRFSLGTTLGTDGFLHITASIVFVNLLLGLFNLMPIPPLDGSKLLFAIFPEKAYRLRESLEKYGFMLVLLFIFFVWNLISPLVSVLFSIITGIPLSSPI